MLLAIDIGNTNTVIGLFEGETLEHHWRLETKKERTGDEWGVYLRELFRHEKCDIGETESVIISSVVPPMERALNEMCRRYLECAPLYVTSKVKLNIKIAIDNPDELGADRIVNSVAAWHKYKTDLIVVDFGTATTFDFISKKGEYRGGLILPGIGISLEALLARATKLPRIEIAKPGHVIGTNTVESMQSGIYYGYAGMIDSVVERIEKEIGKKAKVLATGGLAPMIAADSKKIAGTDELLTLKGLKLIYEWNRKE
ncbi:MAG: type III pantothenate kinase [Deltaproteobacteria bacterium]|nr:type III pantothenate kinase [Deltaproteobacteria bacterium]